MCSFQEHGCFWQPCFFSARFFEPPLIFDCIPIEYNLANILLRSDHLEKDKYD